MPTNSTLPGLLALGWDDGWAASLATLTDPAVLAARVSRVDRGMCTVMTGTAELRVAIQHGVGIAIGDWVGIGPGPASGDAERIVSVLPRRCVFRRPAKAEGMRPQIVAANIDTVMLCVALDGALGLRHLERFLALTWQSGAAPVLVLTKADAVSKTAATEATRAVQGIAGDTPVTVISSTTGAGIEEAKLWLTPGRTVALMGRSGAGKSTLVNLLAGVDVLATGAVRKDGSGRHTTTHRQLVLLPQGGVLIDTPGMRALSVLGAGEGVEQAFTDIADLARQCRYPECSHSGEQGCALAAAVTDGRLERGRVESWLQLTAQPESSAIDDARRSVAERKRRKAAKVAEARAARR